MEGRRLTTVRQLELLVEFAEAHRDLALGRLRSKEARALAKRLWIECADIVNSEGPAREPKEWTKVWNDIKSRVRGKLTSLTLSQRGTGGGPAGNVTLSALEEKVADILGRDVGPIANVAQDPFLQAEPEEMVIEFMNETAENMQRHNSDEAIRLQLPGPSSQSLLWQSPRNRPPHSPPAPLSQPPPPPPPPFSQPPSITSTPRRRRHRRQQRNDRTAASRVQTQAQTSRMALDESRAMVMRIEELRARTDSLVAQSALNQSEAAKAQAEAAVMQAHTLAKFCEAITTLVPVVEMILKRHARRRARRLSSCDDEPERNIEEN